QREAQRRHAALGLARRARGLVERATSPVVPRRLAARELRLAPRLELVGRAVTGIREVRRAQALGVRVVQGLALRLEVGPVRAADRGTFVPREREPSQAAENRADRRFGRTLAIGVLDAQHERPAHTAREEIIVERGARTTDVEEPGRAGREADADGHERL